MLTFDGGLSRGRQPEALGRVVLRPAAAGQVAAVAQGTGAAVGSGGLARQVRFAAEIRLSIAMLCRLKSKVSLALFSPAAGLVNPNAGH